MLLQQLLERNKKNISAAFIKENTSKNRQKIRKISHNPRNQLEQMRKSMSTTSSNLLQKQKKQQLLIKRNHSMRQADSVPTYDINGQKFILKQDIVIETKNKEKKQQKTLIQTFLETSQSRKQQKKTEYINKTSSIDNNVKRLGKTAISFYNFSKEKDKTKRNAFTAPKLARKSNKQIVQQGVFALPNSFKLKNIFMSQQRHNSTIIKIEEPTKSSRQTSIHSRSEMQRNQQKNISRSVKSYHSFKSQKQTQESPMINKTKQISTKLTLDQDHTFNEFFQFQIDTRKIDLKLKLQKKNQYINVFYEYHKAKAKIEKQQLYTPWRKNQHYDHHVDLSQIYNFHD